MQPIALFSIPLIAELGVSALAIHARPVNAALLPRQNSIPTDGDFVFSCLGVSADWGTGFNVTLPGDGSPSTSGYDAAGNCGGGVLDNLNGQGIASTEWGCSYFGSSTAFMQFVTPIDMYAEVAAALDAATGSSGLECTTPYDGNSAPLPDVPDPVDG